MATVTITFKDEEDGRMTTTCEFDPPLDRDDQEDGNLTPAQYFGAAALQALMDTRDEE